MIDFEHVSKEYKKGGRLALEDINLHVDDGEFVFLLGHSGAGKSTLLKLILREELPTSGKVTVLGKDVAHLRRRKVPYLRRQMGIIFQDFRLIPSMTVYENIAFAMHVTNVKRSVIRERVEKVWKGEWEDMREAYNDVPKRRCSRCKRVFIGLDKPFCEACGAPMTDEAVDMEIKRLEALYGDR